MNALGAWEWVCSLFSVSGMALYTLSIVYWHFFQVNDDHHHLQGLGGLDLFVWHAIPQYFEGSLVFLWTMSTLPHLISRWQPLSSCSFSLCGPSQGPTTNNLICHALSSWPPFCLTRCDVCLVSNHQFVSCLEPHWQMTCFVLFHLTHCSLDLPSMVPFFHGQQAPLFRQQFSLSSCLSLWGFSQNSMSVFAHPSSSSHSQNLIMSISTCFTPSGWLCCLYSTRPGVHLISKQWLPLFCISSACPMTLIVTSFLLMNVLIHSPFWQWFSGLVMNLEVCQACVQWLLLSPPCCCCSHLLAIVVPIPLPPSCPIF